MSGINGINETEGGTTHNLPLPPLIRYREEEKRPQESVFFL
jgi:hypothetical protein